MTKIKNKISENEIINKFLQKLNLNNKETYNFKNDGAFLKQKKNKDLVVTNDTIIESIDFFKNDTPKSIAYKIVTCNLSDLSSLGANPYSYTLSLSLPKGIKINWIKEFTHSLLLLQQKYNFFLLGGDISLSKTIHLSANFFGYTNKNKIIKREYPKIGESIWVTGNIGDSYVGLLLKQKKITVNSALKKFYFNKYLYPKPCMMGSKLINYSKCCIDISDGFIGDLSKLLNLQIGADLISSKIPFSLNTKRLIKNKLVSIPSLLNAGDDYELIFTTPKKFDDKIVNIAKKNKFIVTKVGRIIDKKGLFLDGIKLKNFNNSFQYFF